MHNDNTIQNELKELNSILAGIPNTNVYTVPDGYFDVLSYDILLAVQQPGETKIKGAVPAGYFDGLAGTIMAKIKAGAEEKESTLLNSVKGINVYRVPLGYFDSLSTDIINQLPQPAKVIEFRKRSSFFNYAAAAVITGIMGLSVISIFEKRQTEGSFVSNKEVMVQADKIIQENSFDKELSTVSDDAIVNYLQESGEDVNAALVASVSDDKNLPNQEDYILDDKTLDNLLRELKIGETTNN